MRPVDAIRRYMDMRMAVAGAFFLGTIVWLINAFAGPELDVVGATTAAFKQGTYTFLAGGIIMRFTERLATRPHWSRGAALTVATLAPSVIAVGATFLVHSLRGTPEPVASTLPTLVMAPPSFFGWALRKRTRMKMPPHPHDGTRREEEA